jgi:hypothetical protein
VVLYNRQILIFDTSVVNALVDDRDSEPLIAGLRSGYFIRFPFAVVGEIIANSSGERREKLLHVCRRLLSSAGDCIEPQHEIIKIMVARFEKALPLGFEHVNLRMTEAEDEILRHENFDEELAAEEREENRTHGKVFDRVYRDAKKAFDKLAATGVAMPKSVAELVSRLQADGAFWTLAKNLYDCVAAKPADDDTIQRFCEACEPFRTLMIALFAAQYDRCIRTSGPSLKSGRNDTFMATCLPYCDKFITNDGGQLACYREVVPAAGLDVTVQSYEEFRDGLFVLGAAARSTGR